jgi:hypothetical protein
MYAALFLNTYISVEHLNPDSGNSNQEGFVSDLALKAVACNIQPASMELTALNNGAYGKSYTVFTTASGILETDRITVSGTGQQLIVKGKQYYNYGLGQHLEIFTEEIQ